MLSSLLRLGLISGLCLASSLRIGRLEAQEPASFREIRFKESKRLLANPERGFYTPRTTRQTGGLEGLRKRGITLILVEMDLRDFKDREISPKKLDELRRSFAEAREHGLKVIFRAAYGFTGKDYRADPKDLGQILAHIGQFSAIFDANRDVLASVQAGFLGPWGEWHGSNHGDPPSLEARRAVLFGLLKAVPAPIPVQIRRPMFIRDIFANEPGGSDLTAKAASERTPLSRTGWHDDALLSLPTDMGTYAEPGWNRVRELRWTENHGRYAPFGGETVPDSVRTPIDQVVRELELLHATYLNSAYHRGTIDGWRKASYQGENAYQTIERRLGYRLVADRLKYSATTAPGGTIRLEIDLRNVGFAAPYLPREVAAMLSQGETHYRVVAADSDLRHWAPGKTFQLNFNLQLPPDAPRGLWKLSLYLADPSPRLRDDGRYAIQLSNDDISFSEKTGANVLSESVEIH